MRAKTLRLESNYQEMKKNLGAYGARTILRFMFEAVESKKWPYSKKFSKAIQEYYDTFKGGKR